MKEILSINNETIKNIAKLKEKKQRTARQEFLIDGYHLVNEAYKQNRLVKVFTTEEVNFKNVEIIKVSKEIIKRLSSTINPQNIIGVCKMEENHNLLGNRFLILDTVSDPGNVGTLIRSALGFGIDTIIMSNDSVDIYNDKVIRSTQGALFNMHIITMPVVEAITKLKQQQVKIIGTSLQSSVDLKEIKEIKKYAIILGNEARGLSNEVCSMTDVNVRIAIADELESLNVAVAGSIVMYYLNNL